MACCSFADLARTVLDYSDVTVRCTLCNDDDDVIIRTM